MQMSVGGQDNGTLVSSKAVSSKTVARLTVFQQAGGVARQGGGDHVLAENVS